MTRLLTRQGMLLLFVLAGLFMLVGIQRPGFAQQAMGTVYWLPDELATQRSPGEFITPLSSNDLLFEHHSGTFAPILAPPYDSPDDQRRQLTLSDWNKATGTAQVEKLDGGTRVRFDLEGLVPSGVYTAWADFYVEPGFTWTFENEAAVGPLGLPDGSQNGFVASGDGSASLEVMMPRGPVGWETFIEGFEVPGYVLEPPLSNFALWFAYHSDGKTHGPLPGPKGFEDGTWAGHAYVAVPNVSAGVVIDDFNDGLESGWTEYDYTEGQSFGPSTIEVRNGEYHLCNAVEGCAGELHDAPFEGLRAFREGSDGRYFANGYLRAKVRGDSDSTSPALFLRSSGSPDSLEGYEFWASTRRGRIGIWRWDGNGNGENVGPRTDVGIAGDQEWFFEAGAVGDELTFKTWRADQEEPLEPQLKQTDETYRSGELGLLAYQTTTGPNQPFGASFDDLVWVNPGDVDVDGDLDADDIDSLSAAVRLGRNEPVFDVNRDGAINLDDRQMWVEVIHDTLFGDADLDGEVQFADFLALADGFAHAGGWAQGDFDGNGEIQFPDFLILSDNFGMSSVTAAAVPEPTSAGLALFGVLVLRGFRRRG